MSSDDENKVGSSIIVVLGAIFAFMGILILLTILQIYIRYCLRNQHRSQSAVRFRLRITGVSPTQPNLSEDQPPRTGLDQLVIASLPKFVYKASHRPSHGEETECSVCLSTILEEAIVRVLPNCKHLFHADCIDIWLNSHSTCPICRAMAEPRAEAHVDGLGVMVQQPTAPPLEGGSASRLSSFRRMLSRERSSRRIQDCGEEEVGAAEDIERH